MSGHLGATTTRCLPTVRVAVATTTGHLLADVTFTAVGTTFNVVRFTATATCSAGSDTNVASGASATRCVHVSLDCLWGVQTLARNSCETSADMGFDDDCQFFCTEILLDHYMRSRSALRQQTYG